jgi:PEP-CTERM motif
MRHTNPSPAPTAAWRFCPSLAVAALLACFLAPIMSGGITTDPCMEDPNAHPPVFCPGATPAGMVGLKGFDEVQEGKNMSMTVLALTVGDLVVCDGMAMADHSACQKDVKFSDILRFTRNAAGGTDIQWLSDISSKDDTDHANEAENGADVADLTPSTTGHNFYVTEADPKGGYEKNVYVAENANKNSAIYVMLSDNPEPSTMILFGSGIVAFGTALLRRRSP